MRSVPDNYKLNPGAVESLLERPGNLATCTIPVHTWPPSGCPNQLVVGYTRGLVLLWDRAAASAITTFISAQQLEGVVGWGSCLMLLFHLLLHSS